MRLLPKLLLAFLTVIVVGVLVVSLMANQAAEREVRGFMVGSGMTTASGLAQELAGYYRGNGSWEGVQSLLVGSGAHMMGGTMLAQRLTLIDPQGRIIADSAGTVAGETLTPPDSDSAVPVMVDGEQVGVLIVQGGMTMGSMNAMSGDAGDLLGRVNRAIWLAAIAAGSAALVVGGLFAYGLTRPLQRLTAATRAVATGDLTHRVAITSTDEVGELATSFNAMSAALQDAVRLRRNLTADIAHELRNPLAVLQGNLEAVIDGVLPPSPENLQPLLDQSRLLTRIVDDLRTLSLAEAGQLRLDRNPTSPARLAKSVITRFAPQAAAKHITLSLSAPDDLPEVNVDAQRIEQVLGNLVSNAIRHTPGGGEIVCRVEHDRRSWSAIIFSVADTGPGIAPEVLPHVFERFYRADSGRARADGGTGLGLAIAKQFVEAHGGRITVENQRAGGAVFSLSLPLNCQITN